MLVNRQIETVIIKRMQEFPVVAVLGPRQCGKSTLIKKLLPPINNFVYLDLEKLADLRKVAEPDLFLESNRNNVVCIDEIQRAPNFFTHLRSEIDESRKNGRFIILGSASNDLLKQSAESLAGRICYLELTPFLINEIEHVTPSLQTFWLRGGFPDSFLARSDEASFTWRENFLRTYIDRDISGMGINLSNQKLHVLLRLLAHSHGQIINYSKIAGLIEVSVQSIKNYIRIFENAFIIKSLTPYHTNLKKRLIKAHKIYFRDSGLLHSLLEIETFNDLMGHTEFGSSWEGFALEQITANLPKWKAAFYRTSNGAEIDLILTRKSQKIAVEFKSSKSPNVSKGFFGAMADLKIRQGVVICPVQDAYFIKDNVQVLGINHFIKNLQELG